MGWDKVLERRAGFFNMPEKHIPWIISLFEKSKAKNILDLGCGYGRNLLYIAKFKEFSLYGIDRSKAGLDLLKKRAKSLKNIHLKCGDIFKRLPYKDNFFDGIVSIDTIHHTKQSDISTAVKEIERVLKQGGYLYLTVAKKRPIHDVARKFKKIAPRTVVPLAGEEKGIIHFMFTKTLLKKMFKNFRIIKIGASKYLLGEHYFVLMVKK